MLNVFYVGEFDFNRKVAAAVRISNNCKAIQSSGNFNMTIIGYSDIPRMQQDKLSIINVKRGNSYFGKLFYFLFRSFFIIELLKKCSCKGDIVIYYGTSTRILLPLYLYCKIKKRPLVVDVVEWYDYNNLKFGRYGPLAIDVHFCLTWLIPKCDGIIAISSYLENYYNKIGKRTVKIPILVDTLENYNVATTVPDFNRNNLNLIYAGFSKKKDFVLNVIDAVEKVNNEGFKVRFHLLGPTLSQLRSQSLIDLSDAIVCHGKIPQEQVPYYLERADFSVLLRPNKRYAHAGFPTKFVESLNAGLPVIANYTSDLDLYLKDGINGFVIEDCSVSALMDKLKYIISLDRNRFQQLRINARQTAIENFDYRLYSDKFDEFLSNISGQKISN
jgi:glycosyltransferase involved in cell wall biosynthesis